MRTASILTVVLLAFAADAVAKKKKIAIAVGGFSCGGAELDDMAQSSRVEFIPVRDPAVLESLTRCDSPKCWKKIVRKLKADVVIFGTVSTSATRALWLEPRLGEPDVLLDVGEQSPCKSLAGWLARLGRGYRCHQKKCDAKKCLRHVYADITGFGSEPLWKSAHLADGICREITVEVKSLCDPVSCDCLLENKDSLTGMLDTVSGCETVKRTVHLQLGGTPAAADGP